MKQKNTTNLLKCDGCSVSIIIKITNENKNKAIIDVGWNYLYDIRFGVTLLTYCPYCIKSVPGLEENLQNSILIDSK